MFSHATAIFSVTASISYSLLRKSLKAKEKIYLFPGQIPSEPLSNLFFKFEKIGKKIFISVKKSVQPLLD